MPLKVSGLSKSFDDLIVFRDFSFDFKDKSVSVVLGPSGCGKSTFLNILSGAEKDFTGGITGIEKARISYLFQEPRLLPWKTVYGNLDFTLAHIYDESKRKEVIVRELGLVGLLEYKDYYPDQLSGGMRQRAALARAYAFPGDILLMDEPFQALDLRLKLSLGKTFNDLWMEEPRTTIFVTHDIHEAILLGDDIIVLSERPTVIRRVFHNGLPRDGRRLDREEMLFLEKELYALLSL